MILNTKKRDKNIGNLYKRSILKRKGVELLELNKLFNENCLSIEHDKGMNRIADKSIDLIILIYHMV